MQQSEILSTIPESLLESGKKSLEDLIENLSNEKNENRKREIYRKIEVAIIANENINSPEIHHEMVNYFSQITEVKEFDKKLMKLMLTSGWKVPQDFKEQQDLNIKERGNNFFPQAEIPIEHYKKTFATLPIKIEEGYQQEFLTSLKKSFEYLQYCLFSESEANKKNILRININGVELGFSGVGLHDLLENIVIKKSQKELSFSEFINTLDNKEEKQCLEQDAMSLKSRYILDKQMIVDSDFAREFVEQRIGRASVESSRNSFQDLSSRRNSFQDLSSRRSSGEKGEKILKFEGDKFVIKDPDPNCFSFLKTIFCNCFGKENQQQNISRGRDSMPSSDHSLHPSEGAIASPNASALDLRFGRDISLDNH